jgi:hypothetical protein
MRKVTLMFVDLLCSGRVDIGTGGTVPAVTVQDTENH